MLTYDKLLKCDTVLIWLGESKFAEVKPLQTHTSSSTLGPIQEWHLLAECINHLHEKNAKSKTTRKSRSTVSTDIAPVDTHAKVSATKKPESTEITSKWKRTIIDYRHYHKDGTVVEKSPPASRKILPRATGPSETRLAAQEMIKQERIAGKNTEKIVGTVMVKREAVHTTRDSRIQTKLIKEEPNIRLVHRKEKTPENVRIVVTHPSGRLCRHPDRGTLGIDELPDLPSTSRADRSIKSPPRVSCTPRRTVHGPETKSTKNSKVSTTALKELLGVPASKSRVVPTLRSSQISDVLSGYLLNAPRTQHVAADSHEPKNTRVVETGMMDLTDPQKLTLPESKVSNNRPVQRTGNDNSRSVVTEDPTNSHVALQIDDSNSHPMVTDNLSNNEPTNVLDTGSANRELVHESRVVETESNQREPIELETAETLLQLQASDDNSHMASGPDDLEDNSDNSQLLPVDTPMQEDFSKTMSLQDKLDPPQDNINNNNSDDDAEMVIYDPPEQVLELVSPTRDIQSPKKGTVSFKHYGIRRRSPKNVPIWKHKCALCERSLNSKRELNAHHRAEHSSVQCPTCRKSFPTADAYKRHCYIHRNPQQFTCDICQKVLPFESDLKRHKSSHVLTKKWICANSTCGKDFKRKADLELHAVIHSGILHKCTHPGCKYSNLDPQNVNRHQRSHTQEAKVKCPHCNEKFVYYQQMKRHRDTDHWLCKTTLELW